MNILIFEQSDLSSPDIIVVSGRRARHIFEILHAKIGDTIKIGELNRNIGVGEVIDFCNTSESVKIKILSLATLSLQPQVDLILALPRPQMLKRILENVASLGVRNIYLIKSEKVEKSFFSSPVLSDESIKKHLLLGLEQSVTTILPRVKIYKNFKQFIGELSISTAKYAVKFIAHNKANAVDLRNIMAAQQCSKQNSIIAIGPEGGWTENEFQTFLDNDFQCILLGDRILRVETAVYVSLWCMNL